WDRGMVPRWRAGRWSSGATVTPIYRVTIGIGLTRGGPLMTTAAVPAGIVSPHPAMRSLRWIVPLTALWTLLITWQPAITGIGVPTTAVRLMTYGLIAVGLWLGLERTDLTAGQRRTTWLAVMVPYTLWGAVAWSAAINGAFR